MESGGTPFKPSRLAPALRPVQAFLRAESAGGILLLASAIAALAWANSPWGQSYHDFWHTKLSISFGRHPFALSLEHWVNDGLMAIFFLLIGLEIKREVLVGELASLRRASLPFAAALGGMNAPALIHAALNAGGPGAAGWAIPMATDIAFAVGVHATVAGVLLAFTIPASRRVEEQPYVDYVREQLAGSQRDATAVPDHITEDQSHALHAMEEASEAVQTPLARVEHALLRPAAFLIVPLFALANAGMNVRTEAGLPLGNPTLWGVLLGLLVGKPLGVLLTSWVVVRAGIAPLPEGGTWRQVVGVSVLCGIGFTMSLFIGNLAFAGGKDQLVAAKLGILAASGLAGLAGGAIIGTAGKPPGSAATTTR